MFLRRCVWCDKPCDDYAVIPCVENDFELGCFAICLDCTDNNSTDEVNKFIKGVRDKVFK